MTDIFSDVVTEISDAHIGLQRLSYPIEALLFTHVSKISNSLLVVCPIPLLFFFIPMSVLVSSIYSTLRTFLSCLCISTDSLCNLAKYHRVEDRTWVSQDKIVRPSLVSACLLYTSRCV